MFVDIYTYYWKLHFIQVNGGNATNANQQNIESVRAEEKYLGIPSSRKNSDLNGSQHSITHGSSTSNMYLSDLSLSKL